MKKYIPLLLLLLSACSVTVEEYRGTTPKLDLKTYFNGQLTGYGLFQNYQGKQVRRFEVNINASWQGNTGTLVEDFVYDDGEVQQRIWTIVKQGDHYTGTADDVIGEATGKVVGNTLQWQYQLALTVDEETYHVTFDDWMYLLDQHHMINKAKMKKFGVTLGEVTLFFQKRY